MLISHNLLLIFAFIFYRLRCKDCGCDVKNVQNVSNDSNILLGSEHLTFPKSHTKEEIGRYFWAVLHTKAANYPENPTEQEKKNIENFVHELAIIYPCKKCKRFFLRLLKKNPISNENRKDLVYYFCFLHNQVNLRLNKTIFDCKKAELYWSVKRNCNCPEKKEKNVKKDI